MFNLIPEISTVNQKYKRKKKFQKIVDQVGEPLILCQRETILIKDKFFREVSIPDYQKNW